MSTMRFDVTTNDWVIFAPERARRPSAPRTEQPKANPPASECPFCPGNEHLTDPEIFALRQNNRENGPGWSVRVLPNKFPALRIEEHPDRQEEGSLYQWMGGCGAHEVIIETPEHDLQTPLQPVEQIEFVLRTLHFRFNDLMKDHRFQAVVLFKNHGEEAGASLRHPHWQLIATPVVPRMLRTKHMVAADYFDRRGRCLYCVLLEEELAMGKRVIAENQHFCAIVPYASKVPFEVWICPKFHQASFGWVEAGRLRFLAELLKSVLYRLYQALENPAFNLTLHSAPRGDEDKEYFLWHLEIAPRLNRPAGFELGSGMAINTVLPEEAARCLKGDEE